MESDLNESDFSVNIYDQRIRLDFKANRNIYLCTLVNSLVVVVAVLQTQYSGDLNNKHLNNGNI